VTPDGPVVGVDGPVEPVDFRVLGPLRVLRGDAEVELRGDKPRAVLALLLMRRNRLVPAAVFAEEVWGRGVTDVQANLQVVISNVRRALGSLSGAAAFDDGRLYIRTAPAGYSISLADEQYDLARFRRLRAEGNLARSAGCAPDAARAYTGALAQWSGEHALENLGRLAFADAFAQSMEQELLSVLQARIDAELACQRHQELLGELHAWARRYPLNDILRGQLILALSRSGRSVDAAEEYHRFREQYEREMGSTVPESLRRIWGSVSRHEQLPDPYGTSPWPTGDGRTLVDDGLARVRGELVHRNGTRKEVAGRVTIGRVGCDLVLPDAKISKRHAVISPTPDGFVINDLQSTNGTFVNGDPVVLPHVLGHLDRIRLGDTELIFRSLSG
jgi:SARP family transcriptional regulator, regulator of embCAB operon